jgi:pimeloyl-ACP methyl ester carboxylesterase
MMATSRKNADDLRATAKLAVDATRGVTDLVEEMHLTIASGPAILGRPLALPARALTAIAYGATRGITSLVGLGIDVTLSRLAPLLGESEPGPQREAIVSALNAVLGDQLDEANSPLAIRMGLRSAGRALRLEVDALRGVFPDARRKVLVLVHGSGMNDRQWNQHGHDHGAELARDLGYTPLYVHYNSGLHISSNGRMLAKLLDQLVVAWPVTIDELAIVGHSMGGLVARSACLAADGGPDTYAWRSKLRDLVCLGSPHHGSPLERGGNLADALLDLTSYTAPFGRLARLRSAGVTDLRFGNVLDEHWEGRSRFVRRGDSRRDLTLPFGVSCFAIAGTIASAASSDRLGDGLVPVDSALGRHERPELTLPFPSANQWIAVSTGHIELLHRPTVYERLRTWLGHNDPP